MCGCFTALMAYRRKRVSKTELFEKDVVRELSPLFEKAPDIRIYAVA
ncbi:hypothetical protein [Campylobacter showae]|nr:hypothetical protein [Campylobacter showae]